MVQAAICAMQLQPRHARTGSLPRKLDEARKDPLPEGGNMALLPTPCIHSSGLWISEKIASSCVKPPSLCYFVPGAWQVMQAAARSTVDGRVHSVEPAHSLVPAAVVSVQVCAPHKCQGLGEGGELTREPPRPWFMVSLLLSESSSSTHVDWDLLHTFPAWMGHLHTFLQTLSPALHVCSAHTLGTRLNGSHCL